LMGNDHVGDAAMHHAKPNQVAGSGGTSVSSRGIGSSSVGDDVEKIRKEMDIAIGNIGDLEDPLPEEMNRIRGRMGYSAAKDVHYKRYLDELKKTVLGERENGISSIATAPF